MIAMIKGWEKEINIILLIKYFTCMLFTCIYVIYWISYKYLLQILEPLVKFLKHISYILK
jgi:hypothetical protein